MLRSEASTSSGGYQEKRQSDSEERLAKFVALFEDVAKIREKIQGASAKKQQQRFKRSNGDRSFVYSSRVKRLENSSEFIRQTRSMKNRPTIYNSTFSEDDIPRVRDEVDGNANIEKLVVKFPFATLNRNQKLEDPDSDESFIVYDDPSPKRARRVWGSRAAERVILTPDEITDSDLDSVSFSSKKKYNAFKGTSCHQCRQKTIDMKTICRSSDCIGVRGQFCGTCLRNRYGEDARTALKDPNWECPVCREICNCSFCRAKQGRQCTGILIHAAKEKGYDNVRDYLKDSGD